MPKKQKKLCEPVFRPLRDYVLIAPSAIDHHSSIELIQYGDKSCVDATGGDYRRKVIIGRVMAAGPKALSVSPGTICYATDWNEWEAEPHGWHLIREGDIVGFPWEGANA